MRKIIIAGSRGMEDYEFLSKCMDVTIEGEQVEIVSGRARGADTLGERYALENNHKVTVFPALWTKYGRAAGPIRNEQMADYADELCAFWDGRSSGTAHMIKDARKKGLVVRLFIYE